MDGEQRGKQRGGRVRSFLLGGLLGASAAFAAVRSKRPPRRRQTPAGLAAFEDAPCYKETLDREAAEKQ
jgi:hypothetical protein